VSHADTIQVRVVAVEQITPLVKHFKLASVSGGPLPPFSGGSHIVVVMAGANRVHRNPYSLMSSPLELDHYEIGVRRMEESRGGSHFMHDEVRVGSVLDIAHPVNLFPLDKIARKHLLVAGGIGITPIMAQLSDLHSGTVPYELHYAVRSPDHAAFLEELEQREPGRVQMYYRSANERIDFNELLSQQPLGTHLYVCGSAALIKNAQEAARVWGWPDSHIHWEQFSAPPVGEAFDVHLAKSGVNVHVVPDQSLLESIEAAGVEVPYLCRGGVCGFCRTDVVELDGELIHNDHYLSDEEKASGKAIMPCVSRARCKKLVLDL
jgi:dimethylamine monooxygenase subunit B